MRPLIALIIAMTVVYSTHAQGPEMISRATWMCGTERSQVRLSPDGVSVGFVAATGGKRQVFIAPVDRPSQRRVLSTDQTVRSWFWLFDNSHILVELVGEEGQESIATVNVESGEVRTLPSVAERAHRRRVVKRSPRYPREVVVEIRASESDESGLYRIDLDTWDATRVSTISGSQTHWYLDDEFRVRAARRPVGEGFALVRRTMDDDGSDGAWESVGVYDWEAARVSGAIGVNAEGTHLFVVDNLGSDKSRLKRIDVESGAFEVLVEDSLADLVPAGVTTDPATGEITATVAYFAGLKRHFIDRSLEIDFDILASVLSDEVSFVDQSRDGTTWLVRDMNGGPFIYYVYNRNSGKVSRLFSDTPSLEGVTMAIREHVVIRARDGLPLTCDLYLPPGSDADNDGHPDEPLPTILYVHGGPWIAYLWNSWFTNRNFQLLANRGYVVVRVEFRGAAGFGRAFMDASNFQFGDAMQTDLLDIRDWLIEHEVAPADRVGIWGWSYGGYATNMALTKYPDAFACGVSMYGLADLEKFVKDLNTQGGGGIWNRRVGDPSTDEGLEVLRRHSPVNFVERLTKPILITHGTLDDRAPIEQSDRFVDALVAAGKPVTYFVYPNEPHDYRSDASWITFWAVAERFLHEHLGGSYEPYGDDLHGRTFEIRVGAEHVPGLDRLVVP